LRSIIALREIFLHESVTDLVRRSNYGCGDYWRAASVPRGLCRRFLGQPWHPDPRKRTLFKAPAFTLLFSAFSLLLPIAFPVIGFRKKGKKARQHWAFRENTFPRGLLFPFFPVFFPVIGENPSGDWFARHCLHSHLTWPLSFNYLHGADVRKWVPLMGHIPLADMAYLKRRRGKRRSGYRWYVRIVVPKDLQELLGKAIERALNTSDLKEAQRRKHTVVDEILTGFERARQHKITSADIEHEAQRYLRERLAAIQKHPGQTFEGGKDYIDRELPTGGDLALLELRQLLEDEEWPVGVEREANKIGKRYGTALSEAQQQELCFALLRAEIQAVSRALAAHNGEIPEPESIMNARAMDPITGEVQPPRHLSPRTGKSLRIKEAAAAYIADRNRQRRSAWTEQTLSQAETTLRLFAEFMRDAPIETITRSDVAAFLATIATLNPHYGRRINGKQLKLDELLKAFPAHDGQGLSNKTLNRHVGMIAAMFEWAIRVGQFADDNPQKDTIAHHPTMKGAHLVGDAHSK
jgi:hypothetical protein